MNALILHCHSPGIATVSYTRTRSVHVTAYISVSGFPDVTKSRSITWMGGRVNASWGGAIKRAAITHTHTHTHTQTDKATIYRVAQNKIPHLTICNISAIQRIHCTLIIQPHYRLLWKLQFFTGEFFCFGYNWIIMTSLVVPISILNNSLERRPITLYQSINQSFV